MSQPLGHVAQAVMVASTMGNPNVINDPVYRQCIAAALRAVADQVVPKPPDCGPALHDYNKGAEDRQRLVRFRLLAIAAELEGFHA